MRGVCASVRRGALQASSRAVKRTGRWNLWRDLSARASATNTQRSKERRVIKTHTHTWESEREKEEIASMNFPRALSQITKTHTHMCMLFLKIKRSTAPFKKVACKLCIVVRLSTHAHLHGARRYFKARRYIYDKTRGITNSVIRDNGRETDSGRTRNETEGDR